MADWESEDAALSVLYPALLRRLRQDDAGRELLNRVEADPDSGQEQLAEWFDARGASTMATVLTGGAVEKIVNIGHADVVQMLGADTIRRPRQLVAAIPDFVDREPQVEQILRSVARGTAVREPLVFTLTGGGGLGKSALAVRVAHLLAEHYEIQLYVDLRGEGASRLDPGDVLDGFLRSLGYDGARIPVGTEDRARAYRTALADERALILLDNAADAAQVRPLIPGGPNSLVLVTSRQLLPTIELAVPIPLRTLDPAPAEELLVKIVGGSRTQDEPDAVREVLTLCGYLPLAIRVAAAKLASRPHWRIARLADRLRDERRRLSELSLGDLDVRGTFMISYAGLSDDHQRAFRRAGLLTGTDFAAWSLAALLDCDRDEAESLAEDLVAAKSVPVSGEDVTGEVRYRFHDLLRVLAREEAAKSETDANRRAAIERALGALLTLAKRGLFLLSPHSKRDDVASNALLWPISMELAERIQEQPYDWFDAEYTSLVAGIRQAYAEELWECTWELAECMHYFFRVRSLRKDWQETHELALDAARRAGNLRGEGWTLRNLGNAYRDKIQYEPARRCFSACLDIFRQLGNRLGQAAALNNLGELSMDTGRLDEASVYLVDCLSAWAAVDDRVGVTYVTNHLGVIRRQQGDWVASDDFFARSVPMFRGIGDRWGEAHGLRSLADLRREEGRLDEAEILLSRSRPIFEEMGDSVGASWAVLSLAHVRLDQDRLVEAFDLVTSAIDVFRRADDARGEAWSLSVYGEACRRDGKPVAAAAAFEESLALLRDFDDRLGAGIVRYQMAELQVDQHDPAAARESLQAARDLFDQIGAKGWSARSGAALSVI